MTMTSEQAAWFAGTFEKLVANVGQAVLGKAHVIRLWPNRSSLGGSPLHERLRACLRAWGIDSAHARQH